MKVTVALVLKDIDVFDTLDAADAEELVKAVGGTVYSWKTIGKHNWLEKGYSRVDTLALAVLPDCIRMPDDEPEEGVEC